MKIIIVGAGAVGSLVARRLSRERHDVTVIESHDGIVAAAQKSLDVMILHGSGASARLLQEAGVEKADILIAVTNVDEINILSCLAAHRLGVPVKVARVRSEDYYSEGVSAFEEIDQMINPDLEAVDEIGQLLLKRAATDIYEFADGRVQVIGARVGAGAPVVGKSLRAIEEEIGSRWALVAAIKRGEQTIIPGGDEMLREDDQVFVVGRSGKMEEGLQYLSLPAPPVHFVMIVGANHIGISLAARLGKDGITVKLIDRDPEAAQRASHQLDKALVLLGDGTDQELLRSEGIDNADGFVAVSDDEQLNITASLVARYHGARKTIAVIKGLHYVPLASVIGIDAAVSPRISTADAIMRYFRKGNVLSMTSLRENQVEILELSATDKSKAVGVPLSQLEFPRNALVGAIIKPYEVVIPHGGDVIEPGDRVVVFTLPGIERAVQRLF
jgi:trk system potassium uptake protein TrkA